MTNEEGGLVKIGKETAHRAQVIIQEFMILTNRLLTEYCLKNGITIILRNHTAKGEIDNSDVLQKLQELIENPDQAQLSSLEKRIRSIMNPAEYGVEPKGHQGLKIPFYGHWTSPIRRLPDLINHRLLKAHLDGSESPYSRERLLQLAKFITSEMWVIKKITGAEYKYRARQENLNEEEFRKTANTEVLVRAINSQGSLSDPESLCIEIQERISASAILGRDLLKLLFIKNEEYKKVKELCLRHISKNLHLAKMITQEATQNKKYSVSDVVTKLVEKDGKFLYIAGLKFGEEEISVATELCKQKKQAEQMAHLLLLCKVCGIEKKTILSRSKKVYEKVDLTNDDYISWVYTFAAKNNGSVEISGKEEPGTFINTVTLKIGSKVFTAEGNGKRKDIAKQDSCKNLFAQFQKALTGGQT